MANRMYSGFRSGEHPVRGAYELIGFIDEGTTCLGEETRSSWLGDEFTGEDLRRFFDEDLTYRPRWEAMHSFKAEYRFEKANVVTTRMVLNQGEAAENFGFEGAAKMFEEQARSLRHVFSRHSIRSFYQSGGEFPNADADRRSRKARKRKLAKLKTRKKRKN